MDVLTTEEQQVEAIKKWWSENWVSVIGGALVGIGLIVGYRTWIQTQDAEAAAASAVFDAMLGSIQAGNSDEAMNMAGKLITNFGDSTYAAYASLASARVKLGQGDVQSARVHLQWVIDNASENAIRDVATIRLVRLMLTQKEYEQALSTLNAYKRPLGAAGDELRGDALAGKGDGNGARNAYTKALADAADDPARMDYLQMKIDALGGA